MQYSKVEICGVNTSNLKVLSLRDKGTPAWNTIADHCKITSRSVLMKKTGVEYLKKKRETAHQIQVTGGSSPLVDKLEALMVERRKLNQELFD